MEGFTRIASGIYLEGLSYDFARNVVWYSDVIRGGIHGITPEGEHVAHGGPRGRAHQVERQALLAREAHLLRRYQRRRIHQRDECDGKVRDGHDRRSAAVTSAAATSEIFLPLSIAVLRRIA